MEATKLILVLRTSIKNKILVLEKYFVFDMLLTVVILYDYEV